MAITADAAVYRWPGRRRKIILRRCKPSVVRLGRGKNNAPARRGFTLKKMVRKMKLRWLKLRYMRMVKKLKGCYHNLVKEFAEAGAGLDAIQQRLAVEAAAFTVPGLGLSFSSMSVHDRARYSLV